LELRTLYLSLDEPSVYSTWRECAKKNLFGQCSRWEQKKEKLDLTDPAIRAKLVNMGFVMKVRELPIK
jgi:hypothetical protein